MFEAVKQSPTIKITMTPRLFQVYACFVIHFPRPVENQTRIKGSHYRALSSNLEWLCIFPVYVYIYIRVCACKSVCGCHYNFHLVQHYKPSPLLAYSLDITRPKDTLPGRIGFLGRVLLGWTAFLPSLSRGKIDTN